MPAGRAIFGAPAMRNSQELHRHSAKFDKKCTVTVQKSLKIALSQCNLGQHLRNRQLNRSQRDSVDAAIRWADAMNLVARVAI
jgi:hypothetical protein